MKIFNTLFVFTVAALAASNVAYAAPISQDVSAVQNQGSQVAQTLQHDGQAVGQQGDNVVNTLKQDGKKVADQTGDMVNTLKEDGEGLEKQVEAGVASVGDAGKAILHQTGLDKTLERVLGLVGEVKDNIEHKQIPGLESDAHDLLSKLTGALDNLPNELGQLTNALPHLL